MKSILLQLYDGEIFPSKRHSPKIEEYRKIYREHYQNYEGFIQELKKHDSSLHNKFFEIMEEQFSIIPIEASETFIEGFRLGARMMIEIYQNNPVDNEE